MDQKVTIREATADDIGAILVLWHELMDFHYRLDSDFELSPEADTIYSDFLLKNIHNKIGGLVIVVEDGEQILGFGVAQYNASMGLFKVKRFGEVVDFMITAPARRRGLGQLLYARMDSWFKERSITYVELKASVYNELSNNFWRKMGFEPSLYVMNRKN